MKDGGNHTIAFAAATGKIEVHKVCLDVTIALDTRSLIRVWRMIIFGSGIR